MSVMTRLGMNPDYTDDRHQGDQLAVRRFGRRLSRPSGAVIRLPQKRSQVACRSARSLRRLRDHVALASSSRGQPPLTQVRRFQTIFVSFGAWTQRKSNRDRAKTFESRCGEDLLR